MSQYFVQATVRFNNCDRSSGIKELVLDQKYSGFTVHNIGDLKNLADANMLFSKCPTTGRTAQVRIFWSAVYSRWIATTRADFTTCDNLLSKPIYQPVTTTGTVTNYGACYI